MKTARVLNRTRSRELAARAPIAETHWTRLRGLLGRPPLGDGEGLVIRPCRSVHTYGMSYPIDVLMIDARGGVAATYSGLRPGRRTRVHREAREVVELPHGTLVATLTELGDEVGIVGCAPEQEEGDA